MTPAEIVMELEELDLVSVAPVIVLWEPTDDPTFVFLDDQVVVEEALTVLTLDPTPLQAVALIYTGHMDRVENGVTVLQQEPIIGYVVVTKDEDLNLIVRRRDGVREVADGAFGIGIDKMRAVVNRG